LNESFLSGDFLPLIPQSGTLNMSHPSEPVPTCREGMWGEVASWRADSYLLTEKKSLLLMFLYISTRLFPVIIIRLINFENYFCKIKSILWYI